MTRKQTWTRRSSAGAKGVRVGPWHLLGPQGVPWCGGDLSWTATTSVQGQHRPPGAVCRDCTRAERRTARAEARQARAAARAGRRRGLPTLQPRRS